MGLLKQRDILTPLGRHPGIILLFLLVCSIELFLFFYDEFFLCLFMCICWCISFVMVFLITCFHVYVHWVIAVWLSRGARWFHSGIQYPSEGKFASQEELSRSCTRCAQHGFDEKPAWNSHENLWLLGNYVHQEILRGLRFNCEPRPLSNSPVLYVDWKTTKQSSDVD